MPSGPRARIAANLAALATIRAIGAESRAATRDEQAVLAGWSGWGAVPEVFDNRREGHAAERATLEAELTREELHAAERTTLNAHYTDPDIATAMWQAVVSLGFTGGRVIVPPPTNYARTGVTPTTPARRVTGHTTIVLRDTKHGHP